MSVIARVFLKVRASLGRKLKMEETWLQVVFTATKKAGCWVQSPPWSLEKGGDYIKMAPAELPLPLPSFQRKTFLQD